MLALQNNGEERRFVAGTVVAGKYEVERELAMGGVGIVVLARHIELGHKVAIKCLHARFLGDRSIVERFKREARLAASIRSEHVVRVHDVGTLEDGAPYMVMEYLEGEDLGAIVARGPVPVASAVDWVLQACEALAEAHAMGIVHRDLKPENLFLARRSGGTIVKVVDFGISKMTTTTREGPRLPRMTEEGERFGTPLYMSPEQLVSSASADARSDIWALGVVLYELLTAELPFPGEDIPTIIANVLASTPVPLRLKRPDAGPVLDAIVTSCLSRDPALRPADVHDLTLLLSSVVPDSSIRRRAAETSPEILATPPLAWVPSGVNPVPTVTETRLVAPPPPTTTSSPPTKRRSLFFIGGVALTLIAAVSGAAVWSRAADAPSPGIVQAAIASPAVNDALAVEDPPSTADAPARIVSDLVPAAVEEAPTTTGSDPAPSADAAAAARAPAPPRRPAPARRPAASADYMEFGGRR